MEKIKEFFKDNNNKRCIITVIQAITMLAIVGLFFLARKEQSDDITLLGGCTIVGIFGIGLAYLTITYPRKK